MVGLERIPYGKTGNKTIGKPILLLHGLYGTSMYFTLSNISLSKCNLLSTRSKINIYVEYGHNNMDLKRGHNIMYIYTTFKLERIKLSAAENSKETFKTVQHIVYTMQFMSNRNYLSTDIARRIIIWFRNNILHKVFFK